MKYDDKKKMKKYLRFGEIPKNGKSINFFQITNEQNDYFSDCLRMGYIDQAYEDIPEDAYEPGLSVFDMDADGLPVLGALRRMISLLARLEEPAYIITGREVGKGNDGEPLVTVEGVEPTKIEKGEILDLILSGLKAGFKNSRYNSDDNFGTHSILVFHTNEKPEYCFDGWTFAEPVEGFDVRTGYKNR